MLKNKGLRNYDESQCLETVQESHFIQHYNAKLFYARWCFRTTLFKVKTNCSVVTYFSDTFVMFYLEYFQGILFDNHFYNFAQL